MMTLRGRYSFQTLIMMLTGEYGYEPVQKVDEAAAVVFYRYRHPLSPCSTDSLSFSLCLSPSLFDCLCLSLCLCLFVCLQLCLPN